MNRESLRVLHLEADAEDHECIRREATSTGLTLQFQRAANRSEFEAALKKGDVDLILADHCVPGYDGMASLGSAVARLPQVPYIIVSDSIGEDRAAQCLRAGASDFVHKDRLDRLPASIHQAMSKTAQPPQGHQAEDRFSEMADNIRDVFWICDGGTGNVLYVSPAYETIWGRTPDSLVSTGAQWPHALRDEDREVVREARSKMGRGGTYEIEYRISRPDQSTRWIHDRGFAVQGRSGEAARMVGLAADVTDRKRLESELIHAQKMELVGKLAGGIAHDFNNLLTIISGYVSMLLDKENLPPASTEALKRVFTASRQATSLVRQLLLFSRKRSPKPEVIDLNTEVEMVAAMLRRLLGETVTVEFEPAPESPRASADPAMLEQALMNLAVNARDAMPRGGIVGIRVSVERGAKPRQGPPLPAGDYGCIAVQDNGSGIPPSILPRIFEPFFTTKEEGRGTGLGLATAKDIVRRHDGWIDVETELGKGTTFRIYLPLTRAEMPAGLDVEAGKSQKVGKGTILLVEDEAGVREFAAAVLQQEGYAVLQAKSAEAGLEVWQWHSARIDLLLTDIVLPGELSGPQLASYLKEEKSGLRVILTTGYGRDTVPATGEAKMPFVLSKPYSPRALLQAVNEMMA